MSENFTPIRGKVARVLNSREVALNIGAQDGVATGMHFDIIDPHGEDIPDPDTDAVLGSLSRAKVRVEVAQVLEKLSVARTYEFRTINVGGRGALDPFTDLQRYYLPRRLVTRYKTLKASETDWEELDESKSYVKVGDPVVQVAATEPPDSQTRKSVTR